MRTLCVAASVITVVLIPTAAFAAEEISVSDLIELSAEYEGAEVVVEGELVGDYGFRGDGSMWTQLNGDSYTTGPIGEGGAPVGGNSGIGIRMPSSLSEGLDPPGGYETRGPLVRVTGTWRYHDPARQGESYLEVRELTLIEPGRTLTQNVEWSTIIAGLTLLAGATILWGGWGRGR